MPVFPNGKREYLQYVLRPGNGITHGYVEWKKRMTHHAKMTSIFLKRRRNENFNGNVFPHVFGQILPALQA